MTVKKRTDLTSEGEKMPFAASWLKMMLASKYRPDYSAKPSVRTLYRPEADVDDMWYPSVHIMFFGNGPNFPCPCPGQQSCDRPLGTVFWPSSAAAYAADRNGEVRELTDGDISDVLDWFRRYVGFSLPPVSIVH